MLIWWWNRHLANLANGKVQIDLVQSRHGQSPSGGRIRLAGRRSETTVCRVQISTHISINNRADIGSIYLSSILGAL